jgi:hypothetical protein
MIEVDARARRARGRSLRALTLAVVAAVWLAVASPALAARTVDPRPQVTDWIRHNATQLATMTQARRWTTLLPCAG